MKKIILITFLVLLYAQNSFSFYEIENETFFTYKNEHENINFVTKDAFVFKNLNKTNFEEKNFSEIKNKKSFYFETFNDESIKKNDESFDSSLSLLFLFDSHELNKKNIDLLKKFISVYPKNQPLKIIGYTCPMGTEIYNHKLSFKRAESVKDFLKTHGFTDLSLLGKGECCLKTNVKERFYLNRRVEILYNSLKVKNN